MSECNCMCTSAEDFAQEGADILQLILRGVKYKYKGDNYRIAGNIGGH